LQGLEKSTIQNERAATDIAKLGRLEVALMETPWYRVKARKAIQDQINHLVWTVFLWSVSYERTGQPAGSKGPATAAPRGTADAEQGN
jgi:hypothetical protein